MSKKTIIGWVLLASGLIVILLSIYSSYNVFTAKTEAPEIFKTEASKEQEEVEEDIQKSLERAMEEKMREIIPTGSIPRLLNLLSWSIFAGILIFAGGRISGIGIKMLKKE